MVYSKKKKTTTNKNKHMLVIIQEEIWRYGGQTIEAIQLKNSIDSTKEKKFRGFPTSHPSPRKPFILFKE